MLPILQLKPQQRVSKLGLWQTNRQRVPTPERQAFPWAQGITEIFDVMVNTEAEAAWKNIIPRQKFVSDNQV